jgi:hypothetical protein
VGDWRKEERQLKTANSQQALEEIPKNLIKISKIILNATYFSFTGVFNL